MVAHLRILAVATGSLILLAAAHAAFAQPAGIHGDETRMTAPPSLLTAQVRAAAGESFRGAGF